MKLFFHDVESKQSYLRQVAQRELEAFVEDASRRRGNVTHVGGHPRHGD